MTLLDAALSYADRDWPVFPLRGKLPLTDHGFKDATTDLLAIDEWWQRFPQANIGLPTGIHFDVLDIDGAVGLDALAVFEEQGKKLPEGPTSGTGRGYHMFFLPSGLGNRTKLAPGLDWRGKGGYIVAPPSVHPNGTLYRWLPSGPDAPLNPVPQWLLDLLDAPRAASLPPSPIPQIGSERLTKEYFRVVLERELEAVLNAPEGTRNDQLNKSCHAVFRFPELKTSAVAEIFTEAAIHAGLDPNETRRTINSAWSSR